MTPDDAQQRAELLRISLAVDSAQVGSFDWDLSTGRLLWDDRLRTLFGYSRGDFDETIDSFNARVHIDDRQRVGRALNAAITTCGDFEAEYRVVLPHGETRWVRARGQALPDAGGTASRVIGAAFDTTDVHDDGARASRLLAAMPMGFLTLDQQWRFTVVNPAAQALLGHSLAELVGRTIWEAFPDTVGGEFEQAYRTAVSTQAPQTLNAYYPPPLDAWYDVLCWPSPDGLSLFFTDVTERTQATQRAQTTADRQALLTRVADALVNTSHVDEVLDGLAELLVPDVADACVVTVLGPDGRARDVGSWHVDPAQRADLAGYATHRLVELPGSTPFGQVISTGTVRHVTVAQTAAVPMHPTARAHLDALGPVQGSIVPMRAQGRVYGALTLLSGPDRPRDPDMDAVVVDIADRMAAAIETNRLTRARTQLAEDLQRSLLTEPPESDHAQVVVRYLPAARAAQVGGDWYDAFLQPSGATMIVIGDVVGHDTAAAATMGQLRGLLRGIATYSGAGPAEVLRGLDASMHTLRVDTMATAAIARFEQTPEEVDRGVTRMVWSSAGHPPPVVLHTDGTCQVLGGRKGDLLLGVDPGAPRAEHVTELDRGATVLLYTDGLIEHRDADLDHGLEQLTTLVSELADATLDELCDHLLTALVDGQPDDDIAVVAVRLHRQDQPRPAEAGPRRTPPDVPEPIHPAQ